MKFTPREDFLHGYITFEAENTYTAEKHGLTDAEVMSFYSNGWADVEGLEPAPPRQVKGATINPQRSGIGHAAQEA